MFRTDPGPCPICEAPHCTCGDQPTAITQLPMRDAAAAQLAVVEETSEPFTTATYRGRKHGKIVTQEKT
jgi:hypothetical protein